MQTNNNHSPNYNISSLAYLSQYINLFKIQILNWRWGWRSMVVMGMVVPLFSILALSAFARDGHPQSAAFILTGNLVLVLMFELMGKMTNHFAFMRVKGTLDFFATLPVRKGLLVLAASHSFLLLSLPAIAVTVFVGSLILSIPLTPHPLIILVIPLVALPLANIGALIGLITRTAEEAMAINRVLSLVMVGLGSVLIPPDNISMTMNNIGRVNPATYAASAIRQTLLGPIDTQEFLLDLLILCVFAGISSWLVAKKMKWRAY